MSTYGPYGKAAGIPAAIGGIEDGDSLRVEDFLPDALSGAWHPRLRPGRYYLSSGTKPRYRYSKPLSASYVLPSGQHVVTGPIDAPGPQTLEAPILIDGLTQVFQSVRFAQPVPPTNNVLAGDFIAPEFLQGASPSQTSALLWNDKLWWMPLFGAEVLTVHCSRHPRSIDVLADSDAALYCVETPDQLTDDRCYCVDKDASLVYGKMPAAFPPPPFSTGKPPMVYVTLAYLPESDPDLGILTDSSEWADYFAGNLSFFSAYDGPSERYYNPLRLEEVCAVDTDGLIRTRRGPVSSASVVLIGPSGPVLCTTTQIQGTAVNALLPDPTQNNALSSLPYGTTVLVRYYVENTFALIGASHDQIRFRALLSSDRTLTLRYEGDPYGLSLPAVDQVNGGPDLNPLTNAVSSGFLWIDDAQNPLPIPMAVSGRLDVSNPCPAFDANSGASETVTVRACLLDPTNTPISGTTLHLSSSPPAALVLDSSDIVSSDNGMALFRVKLTAQTGNTPVDILLSDSRMPGQTLARASLLPSGHASVPEPSVFIALCEDYLRTGQGIDALTKRIVRVCAVMPDGFPWKSQEPARLVLSSQRSAFYAPHGQSDAPLGAEISLSCDSPSAMMAASAVLIAGYAPVIGDILSATFYVGDGRYKSLPLVVR